MKANQRKKPQLPTPAELRLLQALWAMQQATVEQVVGYFPAGEQPNYKTTHTFLRIMESKGYVSHTTSGKVFVFTPTVTQEDVARSSVNNLLNQSFGGSLKSLMVNLLESDTLKESELSELEGLIRKYRKSVQEG